MQKPNVDSQSDAAKCGRRFTPWLGLASLSVVAVTIAVTQEGHRHDTQARAADAAPLAWQADALAPPPQPPAATADAAPLGWSARPDSESRADPCVDDVLAAAAVVDEAQALVDPTGTDDLPSMAWMPSPADVLGTLSIAPGRVTPHGPTDAEPVATTDADEEGDVDESDPEDDFDTPGRHTQHKVVKGETLVKVLDKLGVAAKDRLKVVAAAQKAPELAKLKAGQHLHARIGPDGALMALLVPLGPKTTLRLSLEGGETRIAREERRGERRLSFAAASVQSSLYADGQDAGLSDQQIAELATIFGWDVDFTLGLRAGDRFSVLYEAEYVDGKRTDDGDILAAEFVNKGKTYRAVRFEAEDGSIGYYAPDGTSMKQAFLRNPLKLARVSSGFSLSRFHPVLQERRAHKGVDYSAPHGTPVKATGTGVVQFSGRQNGYGNVIELQHGDKYTTVYGHLSGFADGVTAGKRVQQGQVIGYVGQTGIATGPHLHYEFRIAGQHRDPLSVKLPPATPLKDDKLAEFREKTAPLLAKLENLKGDRSASAP